MLLEDVGSETFAMNIESTSATGVSLPDHGSASTSNLKNTIANAGEGAGRGEVVDPITGHALGQSAGAGGLHHTNAASGPNATVQIDHDLAATIETEDEMANKGKETGGVEVREPSSGDASSGCGLDGAVHHPSVTPTQPGRSGVVEALEAPSRPHEGVRNRAELSIVHENYPTVIRLKGEWRSVSCFACDANAHYHKSEPENLLYFNGVDDILDHVWEQHKLQYKRTGFRLGDMLKNTAGRVVSTEDVELMRRGEEPNVKIMKREIPMWANRRRQLCAERAQNRPIPQTTGDAYAHSDSTAFGPQGATSMAAGANQQAVTPSDGCAMQSGASLTLDVSRGSAGERMMLKRASESGKRAQVEAESEVEESRPSKRRKTSKSSDDNDSAINNDEEDSLPVKLEDR